MTPNSARSRYQTRLKETQARIDDAQDSNRSSLLATITAFALFLPFFYLWDHWLAPAWCLLLPVAIAAASGQWHVKNRGKWLRLTRLRAYHERQLARIEDRWHGSGFTGEEFRISHHVYDSDLQVLGKGSLFELLCTARTGIGRRRLAEYLLQPCDTREAVARQAAVRELMPGREMRQNIALLGQFEFQESSWEVFSEWIGEPALTVPASLRVAMLAGGGALLVLILAGLSSSVAWAVIVRWMVPFIASRMGVAWYYRTRTDALNAAANRVGVEIGVVREGMEIIAGLPFHSTKLMAIQDRLSTAHAVRSLRKLEKLTNALTQCEKPQFDLASQALNLRTQICFEIEEWKLRNAAQLTDWLDAWGEFEALAAIAGYADEHPDDTFPIFVPGDASYVARGLGHPLIPGDVCVRNEVEFDTGNRFYVISGSNMAGKSTLLRSIGLSVVLANAGAPVRAASLRLSHLDLFASLSIVDAILEGKSKFLAEVERVRLMLDAAGRTPVLFLIDEILSGTNSRDRRIASEAVVRGLVGNGAIGALSTHDLALTEIAELEGLSGSNVHMGARAGDDPMDFDYLLKPGVTRETNALAIAAMMGLTVGEKVPQPNGRHDQRESLSAG